MDRICTFTGTRTAQHCIADSPGVRIERHRGIRCGDVRWHALLPQPSLFCFRNDFMRVVAEVGGEALGCSLADNRNLCVLPAHVEIKARFEVGEAIDYTVVFISPRLAAALPAPALAAPMVGFSHPWLTRSLLELEGATAHGDSLSALIAEGWAIQALAHIARLAGAATRGVAREGGLAPWQLRRAKQMLSADLGAGVRLESIADACGISVAHLIRAFRRSTGVPPQRWRLHRRVDAARDLLLNSPHPVAEVAIACGFSDQSHFTHVFKRLAGASPAAFRRSHEGPRAIA